MTKYRLLYISLKKRKSPRDEKYKNTPPLKIYKVLDYFIKGKVIILFIENSQ